MNKVFCIIILIIFQINCFKKCDSFKNSTTKIYGIDVSQYQDKLAKINWETVATKNKPKNQNFNRKTKMFGSNEFKTGSKRKDISLKSADTLIPDANISSEANQIETTQNRILLLECLMLSSEQKSTHDAFIEQLINLEEGVINRR